MSLFTTPTNQRFFLAQLGDTAKKYAFSLLAELQAEGIGVRSAFSKDSLSAQLTLANKFRVRITLILGQKEMIDGTIIVRDMKEGIQEVVDVDKAINVVKKKLGKK